MCKEDAHRKIKLLKMYVVFQYFRLQLTFAKSNVGVFPADRQSILWFNVYYQIYDSDDSSKFIVGSQ